MQEKVTLKQIIDSVLINVDTESPSNNISDTYENALESNRRTMYRKLDRLLELLGSSKESLKRGGKLMEFDEIEARVMKVLLSQIYSDKGVIAAFVNKRKRGNQFSSEEVRTFIQMLLDEAEKDDAMNEEDLLYLAHYLSGIFLYSPRRSMEACHRAINILALNLHDFTYDMQSYYLRKVEELLNKEVALRIAEAAINTKDIVEILDYSAEYYDHDPVIMYEYIQRDRQVLMAIQADDDLRQYIEKKIGKRAETVFNYASLNYNPTQP